MNSKIITIQELIIEELNYGECFLNFIHKRIDRKNFKKIINNIRNENIYDKYFISILTSDWKQCKTLVHCDDIKKILHKTKNHYLFYILPITKYIITQNLGINTYKNIKACEYIHIFYKKDILLYNSLISFLHKEGKLIFYDFIQENRKRKCKTKLLWNELVEQYYIKKKQPFDFGQKYSKIAISKNRIQFNVVYCEWANYFREINKEMGYVICCSSDEFFFKEMVPGLIFKRHQTLMEGSDYCDISLINNLEHSINLSKRSISNR